jgi:hypothetical protein
MNKTLRDMEASAAIERGPSRPRLPRKDKRRRGASLPPSPRAGYDHEFVIRVTERRSTSKGLQKLAPFEDVMTIFAAPRRVIGTLVAAGALVIGSVGESAWAAESGPTVIELFTSQGCSSCPPANANLAALSDRPGLLALSFSVTYWDRLGWKDTFGRPDYTARQEAYETPLGESGAFTPQMVIDGRKSFVGNDLGEIERAVAAARRDAGPLLTMRGGVAQIGGGAAPRGGADIWLIRYDPRSVEVPVLRGENAGRTLPHKHVVHELSLLGRWTGSPITVRTPNAEDGLRTAVIVQVHAGGPILAATTD